MVPVSLLFLYKISGLRQIILCMCMYEYAHMMFVCVCVSACAWVWRSVEVRCFPQSPSTLLEKAGSLVEPLHLQISGCVSLADLLALGIPCPCRPSVRVVGGLPHTDPDSCPMLSWEVPYPLSHLSSPIETIFFSKIKLLCNLVKA